MKIVIVGDGKVGATLTEQLSKEGHDIVVIDSNLNVLKKSMETYDVMVVHGNGASLKIQKEAGVGESDLLIAATSEDEINIICCIIAKKLGVKRTIARVRNPEYEEQVLFLKEDLGLSMTINPEKAAATEIFRLLQYPTLIKRDSFAKSRVEIVELKVTAKSMLGGKTLKELPAAVGVNVLVCAVERDGSVFIPKGDFSLREGDNIYVTAATSTLAALINHMGLGFEKVRDVLIIGGSRIAHYLSNLLLADKINVKIIENDYNKCLELADNLPEALIINGDGSQQSLLISEGIETTDALIPLTNIDEENLIISMYAHHLGVPKTITKINRLEYKYIFNDLGIESVVSPKLITANQIVRYVRSMENTSGGSVLTVHRIVDGKVEALEFVATEGTKYLDTPLANVPLKPDVLIACLNRNGNIMIPQGTDVIKNNDTVIVVTTAEQAVYNLNDIFS